MRSDCPFSVHAGELTEDGDCRVTLCLDAKVKSEALTVTFVVGRIDEHEQLTEATATMPLEQFRVVVASFEAGLRAMVDS